MNTSMSDHKILSVILSVLLKNIVCTLNGLDNQLQPFDSIKLVYDKNCFTVAIIRN